MTNVKGPIISFADLPSIEAYLSAHEGSQSGFWLKLAKAGAPEATITKAQAIEAALCHGWIDGQLGKFDEHYFLVRMTPRRSASRWSAINRDTAEIARFVPTNTACRVERGPEGHGRWSLERGVSIPGQSRTFVRFPGCAGCKYGSRTGVCDARPCQQVRLRLSRERCQAPRNAE